MRKLFYEYSILDTMVSIKNRLRKQDFNAMINGLWQRYKFDLENFIYNICTMIVCSM